MSKGRLLIDNDAFILLSGANLLDDALKQMGFSHSDARRLDSLKFMLRKPARAFQKYPAEVISRALEACARIPYTEESPGIALLQKFAGIPGVDAGEAVLFGLMAENGDYFLVSNDKTAMRAVATSPELKDIRTKVAGRVYCMESLLAKLLVSLGPKAVADGFSPLMSIEKRISSILSPATTGRPEDCQEATKSFLNKLCAELGDDFLCHGD